MNGLRVKSSCRQSTIRATLYNWTTLPRSLKLIMFFLFKENGKSTSDRWREFPIFFK